jgi:hypothetical protein
VDAGEPLVEFLLRVAKDQPGDPAHEELAAWVAGRAEWAPSAATIEARLKKEIGGRMYLLARIGAVGGAYRVTRAWLWPAAAEAPQELKELDARGDLASDIAELLDEAEGEGGKVFLEILAPEDLLHLARGRLASKLRGETLDPERSHPVALRWLERMEAPARDRSYLPGRWRNAASKIRERSRAAARAYWMSADDNPEEFRAKFLNGEMGELIGIPLASDCEGRNRIVGLICSGGLPFACWLRCSGLDVNEARRSLQELMDEYAFDEVADGLFRKRIANLHPLGDVLLLWDDPRRNPYDYKYSDVAQKG